MSTVQVIAASFGSLIVAITVWKLARHGVARSNGEIPGPDTSWELVGTKRPLSTESCRGSHGSQPLRLFA